MTEIIIVSLISFAGTALGTLGGIFTSQKLTIYRLAQLEKKVEKHNNFIERITVLEHDLIVTQKRIEELRDDFK